MTASVARAVLIGVVWAAAAIVWLASAPKADEALVEFGFDDCWDDDEPDEGFVEWLAVSMVDEARRARGAS